VLLDLGAVRSWLGSGENPCSEADAGCRGPRLACGRALTGPGGQGAGGNGAEQDGRGERGPGDGETTKTIEINNLWFFLKKCGCSAHLRRAAIISTHAEKDSIRPSPPQPWPTGAPCRTHLAAGLFIRWTSLSIPISSKHKSASIPMMQLEHELSSTLRQHCSL
jgi:hypothetical protein